MIRRTLSILRKVLLVGLTLAAVGTTVAILISLPPYRVVGVYGNRYCACVHVVGGVVVFNNWRPSHRSAPVGWTWTFLDQCDVTSILAWRTSGSAMSLWGVTAVFITYPIIAFIRGRFRRWRELPSGQCRACSYDLTGNVSGVCPECGTPLEKDSPTDTP